MADLPTPKSTSQMDPNFEQRFRDLRTNAAAAAAARIAGGQTKWFRPAGWGGDPFDYAGLGVPFARTAANQGLISAIKDQDAPGTVGDVVAASVMIGGLAVMDRAFRVRQTLRRCRATAHTAGRHQGHGAVEGPLTQLSVEYVRALLARAKVQ